MRNKKTPVSRPEPASGAGKLSSKNGGIPATGNTMVRAKSKTKTAGNVELEEVEDELPVRNEIVQGLKQTNVDLELPMDSGDSTNDDETDDDADVDDADEDTDEDVADADENSEADGNQESEDFDEEDVGDEEFAGKMGSDDSGDEIEECELENIPCSKTKQTPPSKCKNNTGKTSNEQLKVAAGGNTIGKSRRHFSGDEIEDSELENIPCSNTKLTPSSKCKNNTGKTSNEQLKVVAGGTTAGKSCRHNYGDETEDCELENIPCSKTKLTPSSKCKNNTGKTSNEQLEVVAGGNTNGKTRRKNFSVGTSKTELEKIQRKDVVVSNRSHQENNTGKATNELAKGRATKSDKNHTCTGGLVGAGEGLVGAGARTVEAGAGPAWAGNGPKKSFAQLFKSENANGNGFQLQLTGEENSDEDLEIEDDDVEETTVAWGHSLIGYIAGKSPSYNAVIGFCKSWTKKCRVHFDSSGWIVVKFDAEEDLKRILEGGPYLIYGKPFIVKAMPKYFCYDKSEICKAQVWVNLPHLPLELWTEKALSKIGSRIGHPILVDSITASRERASFARILIEVDLSNVLCEDIALILPNGRRIVQEVRYEHLPSYCDYCHAIGHEAKSCARRMGKAESHKKVAPLAVASEQAPQETSKLHTSDASSLQSTGESEEESEDGFVEYVSKNRKKALAKAQKPIGHRAEGNGPIGHRAGKGVTNGVVAERLRPSTRPIEHRDGGAKHAPVEVLPRVMDSTRGDDRGIMKTVGSGLGKPGLTKEGGTSIAPRRGSHANLL